MEDSTVVELRALAKERGLKGFSKLNKADLIASLNAGRVMSSKSPKKTSRVASARSRSILTPAQRAAASKAAGKNLNECNVLELKALAKQRGLKNYSHLKKDDLLALLGNGRAASPRVASSRASSSHRASSHHASSHRSSSPRAASPRATSPRAASPRIVLTATQKAAATRLLKKELEKLTVKELKALARRHNVDVYNNKEKKYLDKAKIVSKLAKAGVHA